MQHARLAFVLYAQDSHPLHFLFLCLVLQSAQNSILLDVMFNPHHFVALVSFHIFLTLPACFIYEICTDRLDGYITYTLQSLLLVCTSVPHRVHQHDTDLRLLLQQNEMNLDTGIRLFQIYTHFCSSPIPIKLNSVVVYCGSKVEFCTRAYITD
jgi:hypothetical protein